jgi:hypothetical protein
VLLGQTKKQAFNYAIIVYVVANIYIAVVKETDLNLPKKVLPT